MLGASDLVPGEQAAEFSISGQSIIGGGAATTKKSAKRKKASRLR